MKRLHPIIVATLVALLLIGAFQLPDLHHYFTLDNFRSRHTYYSALYSSYPLLTLTLYFLLYMLLTALSIPGLSVLILIGASLFDFSTTLLVTSFADVFGSVLAFFSSRYLVGHRLQSRYPSRLRAVNQGLERDGAYYLLTLRLIPIFPCFLINLLMGITSIKTRTFYWATQIGKLPHNIIYVNAGNHLGNSHSFTGLLSPEILISFGLIGIFPLVVRRILKLHQLRKQPQLVKAVVPD